MLLDQLNRIIMPLALLITSSLALTAANVADEPQTTKTPAVRKPSMSGKEMFQYYCASCHGKDAKGDGPAAFALKKPPSDLTVLAQKNGGKFPTDNVMNSISGVSESVHGDKEMPVWGPFFSSMSGGNADVAKMRVRNLTRYIESQQVK